MDATSQLQKKADEPIPVVPLIFGVIVGALWGSIILGIAWLWFGPAIWAFRIAGIIGAIVGLFWMGVRETPAATVKRFLQHLKGILVCGVLLAATIPIYFLLKQLSLWLQNRVVLAVVFCILINIAVTLYFENRRLHSIIRSLQR